MFSHDVELMQAIGEHSNTIQAETLADIVSLEATAQADGFTIETTVGAHPLAIALQKQ